MPPKPHEEIEVEPDGTMLVWMVVGRRRARFRHFADLDCQKWETFKMVDGLFKWVSQQTGEVRFWNQGWTCVSWVE